MMVRAIAEPRKKPEEAGCLVGSLAPGGLRLKSRRGRAQTCTNGVVVVELPWTGFCVFSESRVRARASTAGWLLVVVIASILCLYLTKTVRYGSVIGSLLTGNDGSR